MATSPNDMHQTLTRASQTSDPWGRYYTAPIISQSLIDRIEVATPKLVLELGSGSGALCAAAANRWQDAKLVTVDVDLSATKHLSMKATETKYRHSHFVHDVLDSALSDKIGLTLGTVDVAVCNPPYIRPKWRSEFAKILEGAGLSGSLTSLHDAGADLLFLAQNLRLLRKKGKLGLILPDGLITAEKYTRVRQTLLQQHLVEQVVQLPRRVFKGTEAQTYLVVLSKMAGESDQILLKQMSHDGQLSQSIEIPQDLAAKRLDYAFHAQAASPRQNSDCSKLMPVRDALTHILRGTICSSAIESFPAPVFHLSDFPKLAGGRAVRVVPKNFALSTKSAQKIAHEARLALPGDILLARVGRALEERVALVVHGPCVISDCVFALRAIDEHRERLYWFFDSDLGRRSLASAAHGVAARFLSKDNLYDIQF